MSKFKLGQTVIVRRPDKTIQGTVSKINREYWVKVKGGDKSLFFDEWFPISSRMVTVKPLEGEIF